MDSNQGIVRVHDDVEKFFWADLLIARQVECCDQLVDLASHEVECVFQFGRCVIQLLGVFVVIELGLLKPLGRFQEAHQIFSLNHSRSILVEELKQL